MAPALSAALSRILQCKDQDGEVSVRLADRWRTHASPLGARLGRLQQPSQRTVQDAQRHARVLGSHVLFAAARRPWLLAPA